MTHEKLIKIANEYLENKISLGDLAANHGLSKTTLIRYFNGENVIVLPSDVQEKIDDVRKRRFIESKSTSGNKGHFSLSVSQIKKLATEYISGDELSLRDVAAFNKVNPATIYNLFTKDILGDELYNAVKSKYEKMRLSRSKKA